MLSVPGARLQEGKLAVLLQHRIPAAQDSCRWNWLKVTSDVELGLCVKRDLSLEECGSCSIVNSMPRCVLEFPWLVSQAMAVARELFFV